APAAPAMNARRSNPDVGLESDMRRPPPRLLKMAHACAFAVQPAAAVGVPSRGDRNSVMSGGLKWNSFQEAPMNKLFLSSAVALFLLAPAHAQSVGEKTGVNSVLGISPTTQDFVTEAANSDMMEIAAAKLAQDKGNADEKKFAEQMVTDHTKTTNDI